MSARPQGGELARSPSESAAVRRRGDGDGLALHPGMVLILAIILGLAWLLGFAVFHVAGAAIHILLVLAFIAVIVHIARVGRSGTSGTAGTVTR